MFFIPALVAAMVGFVSANPLQVSRHRFFLLLTPVQLWQTDAVPGTCGDPRSALPLLTAYSVAGGDHFYTTDVAEHQQAVAKLGYSYQVGTSGYIFPSQQPHTVPLYRMYAGSIVDHFYTVNEVERAYAIQRVGYTDEGIAGYVYADTACGALPVYRLYSDNVTDHYYTTSAAEKDNAINNLTYHLEGVNAFYMLPF
ncbi:hypothetical protein K443DRAFT_581000 [Laccaria amethystina LaAM-08-1]|uniref:Unplaced genomic scaffold K443scaffold_78, whole genome shotgun sequence n=1 Tax=Laccaria amethystina LaAM-08-1 TaxID=1095629 RepID=A0A0C9XZ35_9AGAR|nr:hypothetical protein K443DRAFT_581000 [Laccaria amethystina LaAM-08-1]